MDDRVGRLVAQWEAERPDLDLETMASAARVMAAGQLVSAQVEALAGEYGMSRAEGDLLFTLRRAGAPYRLLPSQLSGALLVSSGTMTSRLDRLEARGLIRRVPNPDDRRSVAVELTRRGLALVDEAVTRHVDAEREMLAPLSARERATLDRLLAKLIERLSETSQGSPR
jgi:DNA-binding MarR family transcriptional regulator